MSIKEMLFESKKASFQMAGLGTEIKNQILLRFAELIELKKHFLLEQNALDMTEQKNKIAAPLYQRLKLDENKLRDLATGIRGMVQLEDPVGIEEKCVLLDEGLQLKKISVPLGVLGIIFESRPDVIPQILSLVLKSGNVAVLKGGTEALNSNRAFMSLVGQLNQEFPQLPIRWAQLVETREEISELLKYPEYVDLVIPRGSNQLVQHIMKNTQIPVLGHADGICHVFMDESFNQEIALDVIIDSKAQYPSACNAMETLLVHSQIAKTWIPKIMDRAKSEGIEIFACERSRQIAPELTAVDDWGIEYGDLKFSLKIVNSINEAIEHINIFGSHHTDCILSDIPDHQKLFCQLVDSACVFINCSTRFADGFRFGMGAEVGISTAKTHARGPVGLDGLVIYKYQLTGKGQTVAMYSGPNAKSFVHKVIS